MALTWGLNQVYCKLKTVKMLSHTRLSKKWRMILIISMEDWRPMCTRELDPLPSIKVCAIPF